MRRRCGSGIGPGVGSAPERPSTPSPAVDPLRAFVETGGDLRISTGWISGQKLGMFSAAKIAANIRSKGEILQTLEFDHQNLWDFGEALECTKKSLDGFYWLLGGEFHHAKTGLKTNQIDHIDHTLMDLK